jgi:hypothetical protein
LLVDAVLALQLPLKSFLVVQTFAEFRKEVG